jgi:hypothetical protein
VSPKHFGILAGKSNLHQIILAFLLEIRAFFPNILAFLLEKQLLFARQPTHFPPPPPNPYVILSCLFRTPKPL